MIPASGDNSDGDISKSKALLKEAILSCSSTASNLTSPLASKCRLFEQINQSDNDGAQVMLQKNQNALTSQTATTAKGNTSNLISNGNVNKNRVHVDDNYNYQHFNQYQDINNHYNQRQQQELLYDSNHTGDNNSYTQQNLNNNNNHHFYEHSGDLSESLSALYLPTVTRQLGTTIMSGLNWINQIDFNNLLTSLVNTSNIFRRRNSTTPIVPSSTKNGSGASATLAAPLSSSSSTTTITSNTGNHAAHLQPYSSSTLQTKLVAKMLNGALLKPQQLQQSSEETIELESFGVVELDNDESGIGHDFQRYENDKPTWCDACAEFLTQPVMNDNKSSSKSISDCFDKAEAFSSSATTDNSEKTFPTTENSSTTTAPVAVQTDQLMRTYLQCRRCEYVCHLKCVPIIRINCPGRPAVSAVASSSPPANYRRRSLASSGNANSKRSLRLQRNSVRFDGGSLFPETIPAPKSVEEVVVESPTSAEKMDKIFDQIDNNKEINLLAEGEVSPPSNLSSPDGDSTTADPMTTSEMSLATEDEVGSNLPTDTASVFADSRTLDAEGLRTEDEDATLCEESSTSSGNSCTADLEKANDVTYTLVNGDVAQQPNFDQNKPVNSRTYTKKMQQQQQKQQLTPELLTPSCVVDLKSKILRYNERIRGKGSGLGITLINENQQLFRGFLRVHMNLTRPINVIAGKRPPSIYDIINEEEGNNNNNPNLNQRRTLTSFYMPRDTVKNIHITSESTSLQVIKAMLKKFKVVDNPQKFALYLRRRFPEEELQQQQNKAEKEDAENEKNGSANSEENRRFEQAISSFLTPASTNLYEHSLKRLHDGERPLVLQLEFDSLLYGAVDIVLQENDNADIAWDAFEVPELRNFLKILDREEAEHLDHVRTHFVELKRVIRALVEYEDRKHRTVDISHPSSDPSSPVPGESGDSGGGGASAVVSVVS